MARRKGSKKSSSAPPKPLPDRTLLLSELTALFNSLHMIHDVIVVCVDASLAHNSDPETEVAAVLRTYASNRLFGQLEALTKIIESLGGKTRLTAAEEDE